MDPTADRAWAAKRVTADEAVRLIPPGHRVLIGSGAAEPIGLVEAMVTNADQLGDNEIVHLLTLGPAPYVRPELQRAFRHKAFFIGPNVREAVQAGRADFVPIFLSEIPELIRSGRLPIDVALIQVSPPDDEGMVSLGVSVDIVRAAVEAAPLVLAEVNPRMPRTGGESRIPLSRILRWVPVDRPLPELSPPPPDAVEREIGRHVASLVPNGATIQVGIGRIPNAVLASLSGHSDLGVHTEMLSDGVMTLARAGVINGRRKTVLPGKMVTSFLMGTQRLYEWADQNPDLELRPSDFTNDPMVIAQHERMVSINTALAVDLTGQVAADTLAGRFYSGIGGQVDFVRGAARSKGGRAIIALPSTAKSGTMSRIQSSFEAGAAVVTSRGDVRYVVTEFGVADLWGKSVRERAIALIAIAHPDFRDRLLEEAKDRRYVFPDQIVPRALGHAVEERLELLQDKKLVVVRPLRVSDEPALQRLFYTLSPESTYRRFLTPKRLFPHAEMQALVDLNDEKNMALVVCSATDGDLVAMARYDLEPPTGLAEIAFVVRDRWQGLGVGTLLMKRMIEIAKVRGLRGFSAEVLNSNHPMLSIFKRSGLEVRHIGEGEACRLEAPFIA